ncbi:hypothetical protein HK096_003921 [Nowakowskiella sp. JEL0078]|nr:hypothetical protein HK096_003921 [Nowakowskiella sp. JEL0078]
MVGLNPKINNLMQGFDSVKYEIIWILDSNVRIDAGCLGRSVAALQNPGVGLVHHIPVIYKADSLGSHLEWSFMNSVHARLYVVINWLRLDSCIVGKSLVFWKRDLLSAANFASTTFGWPKKHVNYVGRAKEGGPGLAYYGQFLAEDNFIGMSILRSGLKHCLTNDVAIQFVGSSMSTKEFFIRRMRWIRTRMFAVPLATIVEPITESTVNGLLGAYGFDKLFGISPFLFVPIHFALWLASDYLISTTMDPDSPGFSFDAWCLREITAIPLYVYSIFGSTVDWRGTIYQLNWDGTIGNGKTRSLIGDKDFANNTSALHQIPVSQF